MNNEIKEILSLLNSSSWSNEAKQIEDYITNLQQELEEEKRIEEADLKTIQRLEEENERIKQTQYVWSYDLDMQLEDYKSRCEKASEILKKLDLDKYTYTKENRKHTINDLLNILQNGDVKNGN